MKRLKNDYIWELILKTKFNSGHDAKEPALKVAFQDGEICAVQNFEKIMKMIIRKIIEWNWGEPSGIKENQVELKRIQQNWKGSNGFEKNQMKLKRIKLNWKESNGIEKNHMNWKESGEIGKDQIELKRINGIGKNQMEMNSGRSWTILKLRIK